MSAKAQGWQKIRQFAHKPKVRRNANRIANLQADQGLQMSPWPHMEAVKRRVDLFRVNWKGILFCDAQNRLFDPKPRLARRGR